MEVQLYVYDLTRGMARQMSSSLLGIHIDAVYHTSLVFNNIEYFFGMGIQTCYPGSTHHGRPMEVVSMGATHLPMETILEYLDNMREIYTPESYDLFAHNCNNFTNDFAMFLVGKGIPDHITNLPERVLDTPFGQMLRPQIDAGMRAVTQAPVPPRATPSSNTSSATRTASQQSPATTQANSAALEKTSKYGKVINVNNIGALDKHLKEAEHTAATVFFTSSTCAPCKVAYPMFDRLAEQHANALFVKVDINEARDVGMRYQVRATPTFVTVSKGAKQLEWSGADPNLLKANVESLMQQMFPPHPHTLLKVPTLQFGSLKPVTYSKIPPLDKLMTKLGSASSDKDLRTLRTFVEKRSADPKEATLPDLQSIAKTFQSTVLALPVDVRFAAVDLLRCAMIDPRVSGYFAEKRDFNTVSTLVKHVNGIENCPHNLRLVTLHLACNLFTSPLSVKGLMRTGNSLSPILVEFIASSLLDVSHPTTRVAAASLAFDLAVSNYRVRREEERDALAESEQVELAASIVEALSHEENCDAAKALMLALGYLVYCAPQEGELMDLMGALDAKAIVSESKFHETISKEVVSLL